MGRWRQPQSTSQRYPRTSTAVAVRISTVDPEVDPDTGKSFFRNVEATTANLSRGGAYVHSWEPLAPGRRVLIAIDLGPGHEVQLVARVAWTQRRLQPTDETRIDPPGYGIEFVGETGAELAALDRYLESLAPPTPKPRTHPALPVPAPARS